MSDLPQDSAFGFMPQTNADADVARKRGWWVSEVEHMPNGMVRVAYSFPRMPNRITYIGRPYWNARTVELIGRNYGESGVPSELPSL